MEIKQKNKANISDYIHDYFATYFPSKNIIVSSLNYYSFHLIVICNYLLDAANSSLE